MSILSNFRNPWEADRGVLESDVLDMGVLENDVLNTNMIDTKASILNQKISQKGYFYIYAENDTNNTPFLNTEELNTIKKHVNSIFTKNGIDFIKPIITTKEEFQLKNITSYDSFIKIDNSHNNFTMGSSYGVSKISDLISDKEPFPYFSLLELERWKEINQTFNKDDLYIIGHGITHEAWHQYLNKAGYYWFDIEHALTDHSGHYSKVTNLIQEGETLLKSIPTTPPKNKHSVETILQFQLIPIFAFFAFKSKIGKYVPLPIDGNYLEHKEEWLKYYKFSDKRFKYFHDIYWQFVDVVDLEARKIIGYYTDGTVSTRQYPTIEYLNGNSKAPMYYAKPDKKS